MKIRKNFIVEFSVALIVNLLLCNSVLAFSTVSFSKVFAQETYTYYGFIPAKIYRYNLTIEDDPNSGWRLAGNATTVALVAIVGITDYTHVKVTDQSNDTLVSETTINSMQKHYVILPNGTFFKVETSELVGVLLINYGTMTNLIYNNETFSPAPNTFYQSTNGAYVGKEFILISSQTHGNVQYSIQYAVFALEKSTVTVTREDGDEHQYTIDVNGWKELMLDSFKAYKIVSTGNIMIQSGRPVDIWGDARTFYIPAAVGGGFVGQTFYSWSASGGSWDFVESYGFRVSATQNTKITVYSLETKQPILTADVPGGSGFGFKPQPNAFVVQSDHPVLLEYVHNGSLANSQGHNGTYGAYGSGVGFFGVKPNEDTPFYLPMDSFVEAYVFASEDTTITLDDYTYTVKADSHYLLTMPGTHIIRSNKNVIVETLNWPNQPENQGLLYDGTQVPCVQTADAVTNVTLTPLEGLPFLYIIIGAAVAIIAVVVVFLFMRGRSRK